MISRKGRKGRKGQSRKKTWRCFHCNEVFRSEVAARAHFGPAPTDQPACQVSAAELRDLELQLHHYRSEDTDLHRQIARLESDKQREVRRAEEDGYAKGLQDGRQLTSADFA